MVIEDTARVKDYLTKTKLTGLDYVINPYVGCPHKCLYCYASYMSCFSKHKEAWGEFVDVKQTRKRINLFKIKNKKVMISTVTDPYNYLEKKYNITRMIMQQLVHSEADISVVTKSKLVLRDIDLFKQMKNIKVAISISTLDEHISSQLEPCASPVNERIETLKELKKSGIKTVLFMSPILPYFTDFQSIIQKTKDFIDEYWFDKLNLRSSFKTKMFDFIKKEYPQYIEMYSDLYILKKNCFWDTLKKDIDNYCFFHKLNYNIFIAGT